LDQKFISEVAFAELEQATVSYSAKAKLPCQFNIVPGYRILLDRPSLLILNTKSRHNENFQVRKNR